MARVEITTPEYFPFKTEITVLIQHINIGKHLANEHLVAFLNEARVRYMNTLPDEHFGPVPRPFINADLAVIYKNEAFYGDVLQIEVAAQDFNRYGCDFIYRVTRKSDQALIAVAKTAMLQYDFTTGKLKPVSEQFPSFFNG